MAVKIVSGGGGASEMHAMRRKVGETAGHARSNRKGLGLDGPGLASSRQNNEAVSPKGLAQNNEAVSPKGLALFFKHARDECRMAETACLVGLTRSLSHPRRDATVTPDLGKSEGDPQFAVSEAYSHAKYRYGA
ncbi:hypothetical protein [Oceanicella sp. SM1341]|uniref:hypothetical protein n=1 Tax=Oceanicella sp. SM1341 TaxID=1548889 RepID=UPI00130073AA|nr:hypothetical protein [Oceanicella sp. SM1341]